MPKEKTQPKKRGGGCLVLTRRPGESVIITTNYGERILVRRHPDSDHTLVFQAPMGVEIVREEIEHRPAA